MMMIRQTARLLTTGTYDAVNGTVDIEEGVYPASLTNTVQELVVNEGLDLTEPRTLILVPNTLNPDEIESPKLHKEQEEYISFTVIGVPVNQHISDDDYGYVQVTGKVMFESLAHNFVLVKMQHGRADQKIKLHGKLHDSVVIDADGKERGTAKEKLYWIEAIVQGDRLVILDSEKIVQKPILKPRNVIQMSDYRNEQLAA